MTCPHTPRVVTPASWLPDINQHCAVEFLVPGALFANRVVAFLGHDQDGKGVFCLCEDLEQRCKLILRAGGVLAIPADCYPDSAASEAVDASTDTEPLRTVAFPVKQLATDREVYILGVSEDYYRRLVGAES